DAQPGARRDRRRAPKLRGRAIEIPPAGARSVGVDRRLPGLGRAPV
ncbi:MAG: hypothetical protein AVDCRST_MAG79-2844, partial [uncultured Thermoleophilia bacterium]